MTTNVKRNDRLLEAVVIVAGALGFAFVVASALTVEAFDVLYSVDGASSRAAGTKTTCAACTGSLVRSWLAGWLWFMDWCEARCVDGRCGRGSSRPGR